MKNYPNNCLNQLGITNTYFNLEHLIFLPSLDRDNFGALLEQDQFMYLIKCIHIDKAFCKHFDLNEHFFLKVLLELRACLHGVGDPGLVGLVSFVFTLWGTQNKRNLPH